MIDPTIRSKQLTQQIAEEIKSLGPIAFARFMELALYSPGLGYYMAMPEIFGKKGDFITAPEISPLFSACVANQISEIFQQLETKIIIELGAGSGKMAADILRRLAQKDQLPEQYVIYEISSCLIEKQKAYLQTEVPDFFSRIKWINQLNESFKEAVIIANEFLDALPCHLFYYDNSFHELLVDWQNHQLIFKKSAIKSPGLENALEKLAKDVEFPADYVSEINLNYPALMDTLFNLIKKGAVIFFDYGYPRAEYYHSERNQGTLKCFYQHQSYNNPLERVGLQDITAHVDFTHLAEAAISAGFKLAGFVTQAHFIINSGLDNLLNQLNNEKRLMELQKIKKLIMPQEMGEIVKVISLQKGLAKEMRGFNHFDLRSKLI